MRKYSWIIFISMMIACFSPLVAHADEQNYDINLNAYYWPTTVTTKDYTVSNGSWGADVGVRFKKGSGMENWGFGVEYSSTPNGPRFGTTGSTACPSTVGQTSGSFAANNILVSLGGGACGAVTPGTFTMFGGKAKYFFPTSVNNLNVGIYGQYLSVATGGRNGWGGGAEIDWNITHDILSSTFVDWSNVTGGGFPSQNLIRFQSTLGYMIPNTTVNIFAGYRAYNFTNFYNTYINGMVVGLGTHW